MVEALKFINSWRKIMEHVAIMKKSWGLTDKILDGRKKIESRWYLAKCRPWDRIKKEEAVYFKDSGCPVKIKARVEKILQFADLTPGRVREILDEYGKDDGLVPEKLFEFYKRFKDKKYCILVFLKNPRRVKPFNIDKKGLGLMSAWLTVDDIARIKK